jgi:hypothetical protein
MVVTDTTEVIVKPKRGRKPKAKTEGGDFGDIMDGIKKTASTVGDVVKTAATVAPYVLPLVGLGKDEKPKRTVTPSISLERVCQEDPRGDRKKSKGHIEIHQRAQLIQEKRRNR